MDESHLHAPSPLTATSSNEESPSFILQSSTDHQQEENPLYQQATPLLISQTYENQFYDHVNSTNEYLCSVNLFLFSFI